MPLFLFHLTEYLDFDWELDLDELGRRWSSTLHAEEWSQIILKETDETVELLERAPRTGIWRLESDGRIAFSRAASDWHGLEDEAEGFFLRILGPGDYRYRGADLGILVTRARLQTNDRRLTERARAWIAAVHAEFAGMPVDPVAEPAIPHDALAVKAS
jgi:hypothetical protein